MKKRIVMGLTCIAIITGSSFGANNIWDGSTDNDWGTGANWSLNAVPGVNVGDNAIIQAGGPVTLTSNFTAVNSFDLTVRSGRTLAISADLSDAGGILRLGNNAGHYGTVNQTAGTVAADEIHSGNVAGTAAANSEWNLAGGALNATTMTVVNQGRINVTGTGAMTINGALSTINGTGQLNINGGIFTIDKSAANVTVSGDGLLKLQSGTLNNIGSAAGNVWFGTSDIEISGGTVNLTGQNYFGSEFKVVGDAAGILSIDRLNSSASYQPDYVFVMDADGISSIENANWMTLGDATISVDGSAYTGGTGTFTLFDTGFLSSTSTSVSVTGFTGGLSGYITQDQDNDIVTLTVIPEPATLGLIAAFGAGMLFIRRRFLI